MIYVSGVKKETLTVGVWCLKFVHTRYLYTMSALVQTLMNFLNEEINIYSVCMCVCVRKKLENFGWQRTCPSLQRTVDIPCVT